MNQLALAAANQEVNEGPREGDPVEAATSSSRIRPIAIEQKGYKQTGYLNFNTTERLRHTKYRKGARLGPHTSLVREQRHLDRRRSSEDSRVSNIVSTLPMQTQQIGKLIRHLQVRPGENGFFLWYSVSNSFPIIAASLGPISNLNSVAALADPWRYQVSEDARPGDLKWILSLNALSLFCGCSANIALFLNFSGRVNYSTAQMISIFGWYFAFGLLVTILAAAEFLYFDDPSVSKSEGYWHAVFTAIFYFISATMLLVNWIGHRKGQYPASFNLTNAQRRIMLQNVLLILWVGLGGLLFSFLLHMRYTDAIYYCVVTVTTIGLGDVVPYTNVSRALILPYALVGVIYLGLIVTTITAVVLDSNGEAMVFDRTERARNNLYEKLLDEQQEEAPISAKESFLLVRKIHRAARRRRKLATLYSSLLAFSLFWLLGALVFHSSEATWSYFDGLYFVSLCLLTIGYGDYTPKSSAGRAFFLVWALCAVPMMTILISNLSDNVFVWINDVGDIATAWLLAASSVRLQYHTLWKLKLNGLGRFFRLPFFKQGVKEEEANTSSTADMDTENDLEDYDPGEEERALRNEMDYLAQQITQHREDSPFEDHASAMDDDVDFLDRTMIPSKRIRSAQLKSNPFVRTRPRRVNVAVATLAERMLTIVDEIKSLARISAQDPTHQFSYEDWQRISNVVAGADLDEVGSDFWLSDKSPVRFPIPEVRYFLQECLEGIEVGIYDMVELMAEQLNHEQRKHSGVMRTFSHAGRETSAEKNDEIISTPHASPVLESDTPLNNSVPPEL